MLTRFIKTQLVVFGVLTVIALLLPALAVVVTLLLALGLASVAAGPVDSTPATVTRMSRPPNRERVAAIRLSTEALLVTSTA